MKWRNCKERQQNISGSEARSSHYEENETQISEIPSESDSDKLLEAKSDNFPTVIDQCLLYCRIFLSKKNECHMFHATVSKFIGTFSF